MIQIQFVQEIRNGIFLGGMNQPVNIRRHQYKIGVSIRTAVTDGHFMVAVDLMGCHMFSRNSTIAILRRIQRNTIVRIFNAPALYRVLHQPKHGLGVDCQILVNQLSSLRRVFVDSLLFMLGILRLDISYRNDWSAMQKTYLLAFSVLLLDKTISQRTFSGQVLTQPVFQHSIYAVCQLAKVSAAFRSDTIVLMEPGNDGIVLKQLQDVTIDKKQNPYLSEHEAYRLGLNIKELFYKSFSDMPKRVVIHKRTPFRKDEISGLVGSLSTAGIQDIELIEISYEDDLKCFALNYDNSDADGFPVLRGLCFPLNSNTMYLYTHGIAPSVKAPGRKYFQGGRSVPLPLKVVRHYGFSSMSQIANEILGLSR